MSFKDGTDERCVPNSELIESPESGAIRLIIRHLQAVSNGLQSNSHLPATLADLADRPTDHIKRLSYCRQENWGNAWEILGPPAVLFPISQNQTKCDWTITPCELVFGCFASSFFIGQLCPSPCCRFCRAGHPASIPAAVGCCPRATGGSAYPARRSGSTAGISSVRSGSARAASLPVVSVRPRQSLPPGVCILTISRFR